MKIRYFVHCYEGYDANDPYNLFRYAIIIDPEGREFGNYLTSALSSNFPAYHPEDVDKVLSEIAKLERGEIDVTGWGGDPGFEQTITREGVTFEHGTFGECPEWPLWSCSLAQYKAALQGWRQFIDMPKSIDSELIIELPDDDSSHFPHS